MAEKKNVALVSVTLNAVNPMMEFLTENAPEINAVNYLDGYMMEKARKEGGINDDSMERMLSMLAKACKDGADGIILTCTIFSPYQPVFSKLFSVPIICPDGAMLDTVSKKSGKTAIICTFKGTVETTRNMYFDYCRKNGMPEKVDMYTVPDAFAAAQRADMETCNRIVREKVMELDSQYDQIVLAQISMSQATQGLVTKHAVIYTSPASALEEIRRVMK